MSMNTPPLSYVGIITVYEMPIASFSLLAIAGFERFVDGE